MLQEVTKRRLDTKCMGLVREETRAYSKTTQANVSAIQGLRRGVINVFKQVKPLGRDHAIRIMRELGSQLVMDDKSVMLAKTHRPTDSSQIRGIIGSVGDMAIADNVPDKPPSFPKTEDLVKRNLENFDGYVDEQVVSFRYYRLILDRKDYREWYVPLPMQLSFHCMARMIERGYARAKPIATFRQQDLTAALGLNYLQQTVYNNTPEVPAGLGVVIPVTGGIMLGDHSVSFHQSKAQYMDGAEPVLAHATCRPNELTQRQGRVVTYDFLPNSDTHFWQHETIGVPCSRLLTYLDEDMLWNRQRRIVDRLRAFQAKNAKILSTLYYAYAHRTLVVGKDENFFNGLKSEMTDMMLEPDWNTEFRASPINSG